MTIRLNLNFVSLISSPICSYSRLSALVLNCAKPTTTSHCYWRANPNLIFHRFQCDIMNADELPKGLKRFKSLNVFDSRITYAFPIRREVAAIIANRVMSSVLKKNKKTHVIEINPGPGLISQELFRNKLDKLIVYDCFEPRYFMGRVRDNADKITYIYKNVITRGKVDVSIFYSMINQGIHYIVIVSLPHWVFIRRLSYHIIVFNWNLLTNVEFYMTVSESIFKSFFSNKTHLVRDYALWFVLFDIEILDEFKCHDFLPVAKRREKLYLVRFAKKPVPLLKKTDIKTYLLFLINVIPRKSELLIKNLEYWFPGIGPPLIARGIKGSSLVQDLEREELLKLFLIIKDLGYDVKGSSERRR